MQIESQADLRRPQKMWDEYGRDYYASIEKRTGHPCGLIDQGSKWSARAKVRVPQKYLTLVEDRPDQLRIDWQGMIDDAKAARAAWRQEVLKWGIKFHGSAFDAKSPITDEVRSVVGQEPPTVEPIIAAMQGNGWMLGTRDYDPDNKADVELKTFFPEPIAEDVKSYDGLYFGDKPKGRRQSAGAVA